MRPAEIRELHGGFCIRIGPNEPRVQWTYGAGFLVGVVVMGGFALVAYHGRAGAPKLFLTLMALGVCVTLCFLLVRGFVGVAGQEFVRVERGVVVLEFRVFGFRWSRTACRLANVRNVRMRRHPLNAASVMGIVVDCGEWRFEFGSGIAEDVGRRIIDLMQPEIGNRHA